MATVILVYSLSLHKVGSTSAYSPRSQFLVVHISPIYPVPWILERFFFIIFNSIIDVSSIMKDKNSCSFKEWGESMSGH